MPISGRTFKTEGIVLKRRNSGEQDRIITIFTPFHGKLKVLAKGIRRVPSRRAGHVEVFTHATFTLYKGKTFEYVQEVQTKTSFPSIIQDLKKVSYCYYLCELVDRLVPEAEELPDVFTRFLKSIVTIAHSTTQEESHTELHGFALDLLWTLGYLPKSQTLSAVNLDAHIETIIERKLKTAKLLELTS